MENFAEMGRSGAAPLRGRELAFSFGGYVAFRELGAFAEEELLHLFFHNFLGIGIERVEAIFVHHHFGMLDPQLPGILGNALEDAPTCSECGMLMVPNGACYKCENCGSTSGCS